MLHELGDVCSHSPARKESDIFNTDDTPGTEYLTDWCIGDKDHAPGIDMILTSSFAQAPAEGDTEYDECPAPAATPARVCLESGDAKKPDRDGEG